MNLALQTKSIWDLDIESQKVILAIYKTQLLERNKTIESCQKIIDDLNYDIGELRLIVGELESKITNNIKSDA